jgi:hypothetical protein
MKMHEPPVFPKLLGSDRRLKTSLGLQNRHLQTDMILIQTQDLAWRITDSNFLMTIKVIERLVNSMREQIYADSTCLTLLPTALEAAPPLERHGILKTEICFDAGDKFANKQDRQY